MKLTIERAFGVSLIIHAVIILLLMIAMTAKEDDSDETLVVDLKGVIADDQSEEKVTEQTAGSSASPATSAQKTQLAQAGEKRQSDETPTEAGPAIGAKPERAAAAKPAPDSPGSVNIRGSEQQQEAHKLRSRIENFIDPLKAYVKALTKRVESKLAYPEAGRRVGLHGWPIVSFTILQGGALRADSLKLVTSSGSPKLDETALQTIRACAPFEPPPREITLKMTVIYGH
ncbi:energy transducer TonB [Methylocystis bryophila]|uniref:TonB C-terminal domain-containing protein n=1 Tax=Methylocystis bryophila TaxID=655015 RepID=A0A1W6MQF5_9HYPH|nr:energy transducer TonB [Methylocystis bryophila]ARN79840.1 hypothetical protein B1812_00760 [Methylocystis bryophila]BDV39727.1 hypothetical protein DSM21852_29800 [Methylocystis bryophila]